MKDKILFIINLLKIKIASIPIAVVAKIKSNFKKIVPTKVHSYFLKIKERTSSEVIDVNIAGEKDAKQRLLNVLNLAKTEKNKIILFFTSIIIRIRSLKFQDLDWKVIAKNSYQNYQRVLQIFRNWIKTQSITTIMVLISVFSIVLVAVSLIYQNISTIYKKKNDKIIAEIKKETLPEKKDRPKYYKQLDRQLQVTNVSMPVFVESFSSMRALYMDFTIQTSNRFVRNFLQKHDHLIQDQLTTSVEPTVPDFPLTDEGKTIVKDKIQKEVNKVIKTYKIEGEVEQVFLDSIIGA